MSRRLFCERKKSHATTQTQNSQPNRNQTANKPQPNHNQTTNKTHISDGGKAAKGGGKATGGLAAQSESMLSRALEAFQMIASQLEREY